VKVEGGVEIAHDVPDDDGDVPALDDVGGGGDDEDDGEAPEFRQAHVSAGAGDSTSVVGKLGRNISKTTRELFAKAASKMKAQLEAGEDPDDLVPAVKLEGDTDDEEPSAAAAQAAAQAAATKPPAPATPAVAAPAAADAAESRDRLRTAQLDAREAELAAREAAAAAVPALPHGERYLEQGASVIVELLKEWTGETDDNAIKAEVADLITELSGQVLGFQVTPEIRTRLDSKRALKAMKVFKASQAKSEAQRAEDAKAATERQNMLAAAAIIGKEIGSTSKAKFPFLAEEENPGHEVVNLIERHFAKTGEQLDWDKAAERIETHLKKIASGWYAKRRHLLTEAPASAPAPAAAPQGDVPQGDPSSIRRSRTLTNGSAAAAGTPQAQDAGFSNEARRRATLAKHKARLVQPETDD
jgi:hypothetical protein